MLTEAELASFVAALISISNPIGAVAVFAGLTSHRDAAECRRIAWSTALAVAITLLVVTWMGSLAMSLFGITVDTLRAAGGLIVLLIGIHMLFNKSEHKQTESELDDSKGGGSIAVVPMAIPMIAGPGSITAVLVAVQQTPGVLSRTEISVTIAAFAVLCGILLSFAQPIAAWLGESGVGVVTRVMGMILSAIGMGMLAGGLLVLMPGLAA